jgi:LDH2 family malate/lactate/ureidoglycolate dehydrogenase
MIGICWTNTTANMPPWGSAEVKIGNNPIVFCVPRENGEHVLRTHATVLLVVLASIDNRC